MKRAPLAGLLIALTLAGGGVAVASPLSPEIDEAAVALLDDAVDAVSEDDEAEYSRLLAEVESGRVWLPTPALFALEDRDLEDVLLWSFVLDADNVELLDYAFGAIAAERDAVNEISDSMTQEETDEVNDTDADAAGVLEVIDRRDLVVPDTTRLVLSTVFSNDDVVPSDDDYNRALIDLDELLERLDSTDSADSTDTADSTDNTVIEGVQIIDATSDDPAENTDAETTEAVPVEAEPIGADATSDDAPPVAADAPVGAADTGSSPAAEPADGSTGGSNALSLAVMLPIALAAFALLVAFFTMFKGRKSDQLADIAFTDDLTGLNNRRRLDADIAAQRSRGERPTATLMVDVDHFKKFNDTHGHAMGDEVLRLVGDALGREFRKTDVPYRYGGEEFCVLLDDATPDEAIAAGERARRAIEAISLPINAAVTASIGVSIGPATALDATIRRADSALYEAKGAGRNRVATA